MGFLDDFRKGTDRASEGKRMAAAAAEQEEARVSEAREARASEVRDAPVKPTGPPEDLSTGWKLDPNDPDRLWYWTGSRWVNRTIQTQAPEPTYSGVTAAVQPVVVIQEPQRRDNGALRAFGWFGAIFFLPLGLILGIILMTRSDPQGPWITGLSLVFPILFFLLLGTFRLVAG